MEEKVLIESKRSELFKNIFSFLILGSLILSIFFLVVAFINGVSNRHEFAKQFLKLNYATYYDKDNRYYCDICGHKFTLYSYDIDNIIFTHVKNNHGDVLPTMYQAASHLYFLHWLFLLLTAIYIFEHYIYSHRVIVVTDKNVYLKTAFGGKIAFPIDKITAYGTAKIFFQIHIHAIRGTFRLLLVWNNDEIEKILDKVVNRKKGEPLKIDDSEENYC